MFLRIIIFIIGILLVVIGLTNIILYLNLISIGYSFHDYVNFIIRKIECLCLLIGLIIIYLSIFIGEKK